MPVNFQRPPSLETSPLLDQRPTSYDSTNDVDPEVPPPGPLQVVRSKIDPWILAAIWIGSMLAAFDGTSVATLLMPIASKFNASQRASFIGSSYLLSMCCFTPLYGRLADNIGRRGSWLLALSLFGLGNMWCGMAQSMNSVIVGRVVAGMGGGGLPTVAMIIVTDLAEPKQRAIYQIGSTIAFGLGAALGGPVGGWANDNLGWRWAFYMQAPLIFVGFVVAAVKINIRLSDEVQHRTLIEKLRQMDYLGSITLAAALGCCFLAINLVAAHERQWTQPLIILLFAFSACFALSFVMTEKYWAPYPLLPSRLILRRVTFAVYVSNFFLSMSVFSMLYSSPIFFSIVRSHPSAVAGRYLIPHSIFLPIGSIFATWYTRKVAKVHMVTLHAALLVVLPSVLASLWSKNTAEYHLWLDLLPQAVGFSCYVTTTICVILVNIRREDHSTGIGAIFVFRTTGNVTGVSLGGAVLQSVLLRKLRARIHGPGSEEIIYSIQYVLIPVGPTRLKHRNLERHSAQIIPSLEPFLRHAAIECYADALRVVFICQIAIGLLGVLPCLLISDRVPNFNTQPAGEQDRNSR